MLNKVTTISRNWAAHSLNMGRTALENGANRLRATAELLGTWSAKLTPESGETAEPKAEQTEAKAAN